MKLQQEAVHIQSSGILNENFFSVGKSGVIFDILRNKIYKDPIKAIVREISSNAKDAHREIGKNQPIEIYLPNAFSPEFKIRDYGPGISPDRVVEVFVKYGESTKREDNNQTGFFGIGCKSGFAYSDSFTVITIVNHIKRTYVAYIDETRIGKLSLLKEEPTEEGSGTTICIPVLKKDFNEFSKAVTELVEYWDPKPIIFGGTVVFPIQKLLVEGDGWKLFSKSNKVNQIALIDGIPYELEYNVDFISGKDFFFVIEFKTGELPLAASRDTIQFTQNCKQLIDKKIEYVNSQALEALNKKFEEFASFREACCFHDEICNYGSSYYKYKGYELVNYHKLYEYLQLDTFENLIKTNKKWNTKPLDLSTKCKIYLNDQYKSMNARIKVLKKIDSTKIQIFTPSQGKIALSELFYSLIDGKLSDLNIPPLKKQSKVKASSKNKRTILCHKFINANWKRSSVKIEEGGNYVIKTDNVYQMFDGKWSLDRHKLDLLQEYAGPFVAVTAEDAKLLGKNWTPVEDIFWGNIVKSEIDKIYPNLLGYNYLFPFLKIDSWGNGWENIFKISKKIKTLNIDSELRILFENIFNCTKEQFEEIKRIENLYLNEIIKRKTKTAFPNKAEMRQKLFAKYPMLDLIDMYRGNENQNILFDYIKLVDGK